jgi:hypothetical protein
MVSASRVAICLRNRVRSGGSAEKHVPGQAVGVREAALRRDPLVGEHPGDPRAVLGQPWVAERAWASR